MNKIQIVIDAVLAAAVVALFVVIFAFKPKAPKGPCPEAPQCSVTLPIAYLNVDSLLVNYTFSIEANDKLVNKQEDARLKLNTKAATLQKEYEDFQLKLNNNAFLSRERAEAAAAKIQKKQEDLQALQYQLEQDILKENQELNKQLADSLTAFLEAFNADGRYQVILSNAGRDNILMAGEQYDITAEVIEGMNARCAK